MYDNPSATLTNLSENDVETAMCLWEAFLEFHNDEMNTTDLTHVRLKVGTGQMRHALMRLIMPCNEMWERLVAEGNTAMVQADDATPYDWRFVPQFLTMCTVDHDSQSTFSLVIEPPQYEALRDSFKTLPL